jgi:hypothetical protein
MIGFTIREARREDCKEIRRLIQASLLCFLLAGTKYGFNLLLLNLFSFMTWHRSNKTLDIDQFCAVNNHSCIKPKGLESTVQQKFVSKICSLFSLWLHILVDNTVFRGLQLMPFPKLKTFI